MKDATDFNTYSTMGKATTPRGDQQVVTQFTSGPQFRVINNWVSPKTYRTSRGSWRTSKGATSLSAVLAGVNSAANGIQTDATVQVR